MGKIAVHVALATLLLLSTVYLLQAEDSTLPKPAVAPAVVVQPQGLLATRPLGGREYFFRNHDVVPMGAGVIQLPILMYHYIRTPPSMRVDPLGYRLSVAPDVFEAQMDWLYFHHYHPVTFEQVRAYFAGRAPLPSKPLVITLDDGYSDLYTAAFPILQAHGFSAVAYIVSGFVDQPRYVTHAQVLQMDRAGIEIASHTVDHANMGTTNVGYITYQIVQSKRWLEGLVGHPVTDFAYPSGRYSAVAVQLLSQYGYDTAVIEDGSSLHSRANRYLWGRVRVGGGESMQDFVTNLGPSMPSVTISSLNVTAS